MYVPSSLTSVTRRHQRGVSLIEVVVVAAMASIIFLMLLRWLLTLSAVSTTTINNATTARQGAYLDVRFAADVASATGCDTPGASPIHHFDSSEIAFYTTGPRNDGTFGLRLVTWAGQQQGDSGNVTRDELPINPELGGCSAATGTANVVVMTTDTSSEGNLFTPVVNNRELPDANCVEVDASPTGQACDAQAVALRAVIAGVDVDSGAISVDHVYRFPTRTGV